MSVSCDHCGLTAEGSEPPLTWSLSMEGGRAMRYCEECTRTHVRSMEGKLEREFW
jgi:hypothetical protein